LACQLQQQQQQHHHAVPRFRPQRTELQRMMTSAIVNCDEIENVDQNRIEAASQSVVNETNFGASWIKTDTNDLFLH
jgi:hypothetical protein